MNYKHSPESGRFAPKQGKKKSASLTPVVILLVIVGAAALALTHTNTMDRVRALGAKTSSSVQVKAGAITAEQLRSLKEAQDLAPYRSRADIVKQQEALVKQAYLLDQRARLTSELEAVEVQLEEVRGSLASFQSAHVR